MAKKKMGRPTGKKTALKPQGMAALIRAVNKQIAAYGEDDPIVREALTILMKIARADRGYTGRYIGERMRAVREILNRVRGSVPIDLRIGGNSAAGPIEYRAVFEDGVPVGEDEETK